MPFRDLEQAFVEIEKNIDIIEIDKIKEILNQFHIGSAIQCPIIHPGHFFYRARKIYKKLDKSSLKRSDFSYPPNPSMGRANRGGFPMFYCASGKEALFYELDVDSGDEILLGNWINIKPMLLNAVGYTEQCFQNFSATRVLPDWGKSVSGQTITLDSKIEQKRKDIFRSLKQNDSNFYIHNKFSEEFMRIDKKMYKLTSAIAEMHLGKVINNSLQFAGITYPTVRMSANGDNLALLPSFVDNAMNLVRVSHIEITKRDDKIVSFREIDHAVDFTADGRPKWKGGTFKWTIPPGSQVKIVLEAGVDSYGFYQIGNEGQPCFWQAYNSDGTKLLPD